MRRFPFQQVLRHAVGLLVVVGMAAVSSGTLWPEAWGSVIGGESAIARAFPDPNPSERFIGDVADNGPVCDPRPGPRIQTAHDAAGSLEVTITSATDPQGFPLRLREVRIGPLQNAAVDAGPFTARTTPFVVSVPGSTQTVLRVSRPVANQPSQVTLVVVDDCGDWRTFVGGGTGVAVAPPAATATPVPVVPGQPTGSIPISLTVSGSTTQYPPGSQPRVQITTRPGAACTLSINWPDGQVASLPALTADANGGCPYRPTVPLGMQSGTAVATGTVQDLYGFNIQRVPFTVGGSLGTVPPGDNIDSFSDEAPGENSDRDNADNQE